MLRKPDSCRIGDDRPMRDLVLVCGMAAAAILGLIFAGGGVVALFGGEFLGAVTMCLGATLCFSQVIVIRYVTEKLGTEEEEKERALTRPRARSKGSNLSGTPWEDDPGHTRK